MPSSCKVVNGLTEAKTKVVENRSCTDDWSLIALTSLATLMPQFIINVTYTHLLLIVLNRLNRFGNAIRVVKQV